MMTVADKRHFWLRKIHSLTGLLPIGGYVFIHILAENSAIRFKGPAGWNAVAAFLGGLPALQVIEVILLASILFHGVYGLFIVRDARINNVRYPWFRNWMFFVQRLTGVIAFVFIGYHFWTTRAQYYMGAFGYRAPIEVNAHWMHDNIFGSPATLSFYIVGVVASIFHLTNGMWNMLVSWGITVGPTSQRVSGWIWTTAGVLMSIFGVWVIYGFQNV